MESVMQNSGSASGSMNCPKCGFLQEMRNDCKKCGVVFSKYHALFPSGKTGEGIPAEVVNTQELSGQSFRMMIEELQEQVRTLSTRCSQVEFEKAERTQLRQDLKNIERQLVENFERLESQMGTPPPVPPTEQQTFDPRLPELRDRLEQAESTLGSFEFAGQYIIELSEKGEANARQIADLQQQIGLLREDLDGVKSQLESVAEAQKAEEPRTSLEEDVHIIRRNLDELRSFLSKPPAS
jgi:chromosome segregation ATPase